MVGRLLRLNDLFAGVSSYENLKRLYIMSFNTILPDLTSKTPVSYGAIMYNGNSTAIVSCYPFFTSQSNLSALPSTSSAGSGTISIADVDDYWMVMPGYTIVLYNDINYTSTSYTSDNIAGIVPINYKITNPNTVASFKLFFKGTLIAQP
jgi:hypothetical protein